MDDLTSSFPIINSRYQIFGTIATGGMAVIYKAQDLMLERSVALKVLKKELSQDLSFQNKFRQEARASAKLIHPNIITTFDFGLDKDRFYIVMEYIDGVELKELILNPGGIEFSRALNFLLQASSGLAYAHQEGFIHCDIKPQNMLVSNENILKITDFGISRALDTISREEHYDVVWGSPYYFSPEQASGKPPSPSTDIYSLGVIAYEMFTGQLPFDAKDSSELANLHRTENPRPPIELNPSLPKSLNQIIVKCMSKEPTLRYQSGSRLYEELSKIELQINIVSKPEIGEKINARNKLDKITIQEKPKLEVSTILLALLAFIIVSGLIPFWLYIVLSSNSINR